MGAFEDKLQAAGLMAPTVTTDTQYKEAVMPYNLPLVPMAPMAPIDKRPKKLEFKTTEVVGASPGNPLITDLPGFNAPTQVVGTENPAVTAAMTPEQQARVAALQEHMQGWIPGINRSAGLAAPLHPSKPKYTGGPVAPKPEPGDEEGWQYRFMGRPPTKEELAADKQEAEAQAAVAAAEAKKAAIKAKYFRPELAQVPQDEFDKNQQLMRNLASIQQDKANIEATKLQNESMMVQQQADMLQRNAAEAQERDKEFFNLASAKQREIDKKVQEVGDYKYNPRQVISNAGTLEKMGMIAGAMLGGYLQVMTKSGENQFLKAMDKLVQDEADKQEKELGQKRYMANEAVNSYQRLMQDYKDRDTVRSVRESQIYKAMQTQIMSQALASGSATAIKNAEEANAMMDLRLQQNEMQRWQSMYYNPDLVRGGGGGQSMRKIEEGAQRYGEELQKAKIPEMVGLLSNIAADYQPGGVFHDMGKAKGLAIDKAYNSEYGRLVLPDNVIAAKQRDKQVENILLNLRSGAAISEGEHKRFLSEWNSAHDAKSKQRAIDNIMTVAGAQESNISGTVSPEAKALFKARQQASTPLQLTPKPNMPESTKAAGE
jgi:hypothetical protein